MPEHSSRIALTRRRALGGIVSVGCASAVAGAGTVALFSDTERSSSNTVQAGTLDLSVSSGDESAVLNVENAGPGSSGSKSVAVENVGTLDGVVSFVFGQYVSEEGDNPESETDTSGEGELHDDVEVTVSLGETAIRDGKFMSVFDGSKASRTVSLPSGEVRDLVFEWSIPESVGNDAQGDLVRGDVTIQLTQEN